ncbi:hypothetical protein KNV05_gp017 [Vibrio phage River4]|uniref:Uncharacterized protein n=1 Tax=Vibrio phage River4 TaxID=2736288 RepID=A0A6M9Z3S5_9CAUD|nr:hypothetical protein KNV05_gp017 [Vibrio phage River4]QKN84679.1 hypothetical protein RIVER4_17 [Vibrio phage River4]
MALFMGRKPSDNRPLLHVTSGNESISQLHGAPIASTLFHSDIPYLAIYDIVEITQWRFLRTGPGITIDGKYTHYYEPIVPQKVWDYMNQKNIMYATKVALYPDRVRHAPVGSYNSKSAKASVFNLFVGNYHGGGFADGTSPYPRSPVPNTSQIYGHWDPLTLYKLALDSADNTIDQGVKVAVDRTGVWNVSGLQKDDKYGYQYYRTADISKTASRSTSASYTNPTRNLTNLFGPGGISENWIRTKDKVPPKIITYSPTKPSTYNSKIRVYVLNVRYNSQNNLEHIKPQIQDGIKISREDMVVGDLAMKNGMLISDPAPSETNVQSKNTSYTKHGFFDKLVKGLTLQQLADYPFLHFFTASADKTWNANYTNPFYDIPLPLVHTPSSLIGTDISLDFSADEIKYKGNKGEYLIASKARGYTPYILGGDSAVTAVFPAETKTFAQLKQGARFTKQTFSGPRISIYNPNDVGYYYREVVKQRIKLPPGSTGKNYLTAHISPLFVSGEASSTIAGKKSSMQAKIDGFAGWSELRLTTFRRDEPDTEILIGNLGYSVLRDVSLSRHSEGRIGSSWWPQSSSGNKMQAVRVQYKVRVNWTRNELELVGYYKLTNAQILANEWGRNTYYNRLGERDVSYKIPEVRFGFYITGTA